MPYKSNKDLNSNVKKAHPSAHSQTVFRKVFNSALERTGDEKTAFREAHAEADKADKKGGRGGNAARRK